MFILWESLVKRILFIIGAYNVWLKLVQIFAMIYLIIRNQVMKKSLLLLPLLVATCLASLEANAATGGIAICNNTSDTNIQWTVNYYPSGSNQPTQCWQSNPLDKFQWDASRLADTCFLADDSLYVEVTDLNTQNTIQITRVGNGLNAFELNYFSIQGSRNSGYYAAKVSSMQGCTPNKK